MLAVVRAAMIGKPKYEQGVRARGRMFKRMPHTPHRHQLIFHNALI
jgi:hypothetical protein